MTQELAPDTLSVVSLIFDRLALRGLGAPTNDSRLSINNQYMYAISLIYNIYPYL